MGILGGVDGNVCILFVEVVRRLYVFVKTLLQKEWVLLCEKLKKKKWTIVNLEWAFNAVRQLYCIFLVHAHSFLNTISSPTPRPHTSSTFSSIFTLYGWPWFLFIWENWNNWRRNFMNSHHHIFFHIIHPPSCYYLCLFLKPIKHQILYPLSYFKVSVQQCLSPSLIISVFWHST